MVRNISIERKHLYTNYYGNMQYDVVRGRQIQASTTNLPGCFVLEPNNPESGTGESNKIGNRITIDTLTWNVSLRLSPIAGTTTGTTLATNQFSGTSNASNDLSTIYDEQWYPACLLHSDSWNTNTPYKFSLKFRYFIIECNRDVYDDNIKATDGNNQWIPYYQQRIWAWFIGSHVYQNGPYDLNIDDYPGPSDSTTAFKFYNVSNQDKTLRETTPWKSLFRILKDGSFTMNSSHYNFVESMNLNKTVIFSNNDNSQVMSGNRANKHFFMVILPPGGWKDQNHLETMFKLTNSVGGPTIEPFNALNIQVTANMKNSFLDM